MMRTFKSGLTIGMLVAAMAMSAGCGDNDNGHGDNGNDNGGPVRTSTPSRTSTPGGVTATPGAATPVPTATPGGSTANVGFNVASSATNVQGFDVRVAYLATAGSFTGAGEEVACTTSAAGTFTKNDNETTHTLVLIVASTSSLTFPITISCTFDATGTLTTGDLTVTVREVTQNGTPGDTTVLTVTPSIS